MTTATVPASEAARLAALGRYDILDTATEAEYDDITRLASLICQTPIALISFIDSSRQWFKSRIGLEQQETPRELAFCDYAIAENRTLIVPDAPRDPRFANNPLVTSEPSICFYAGALLRTEDGFNLGTLCVLDQKPRKMSPDQQQALEALSRQVMRLLELRQKTLIFTALVENSPAATSLKTADGTYLYVNREWRAAGLGDDEAMAETDASAFASDTVTETMHSVRAQTDEERKWLFLRFPINDARGQRMLGAVGVDLTRSLHAEEQLERARRGASIGHLASFVAHEFNNVLMGISTMNTVLRRKIQEPAAIPALDSIAGAVDRGKRVTAQILEYGRPAVLRRKPTDLVAWIQGLAPELQSTLATGTAFRIATPDEPVTVEADPQQLSQVVTNLVANARDAVRAAGSVAVSLATVNGSPIASAASRFVELTVTDDGCGMSAETAAKVFEPLFTTKSSRSGFGLAIVQRIVHQHGGTITVASALGTGTTFRVYLPAN